MPNDNTLKRLLLLLSDDTLCAIDDELRETLGQVKPRGLNEKVAKAVDKEFKRRGIEWDQ